MGWGSDLLTGGTPSTNCGTAANAFDDSTTTQCVCFDNDAHWIQYYKAAGITAGKCRAYGVHNGGGGTYQLKGSNDGSTWSGVLCSLTLTGGWQEHQFTECTYKYWRWTATNTFFGSNAGIYELELYKYQAVENFKINIADVFKDVTEVKINIGDSWKTVTEMKINIGDAWKDIF